MGYTTEKLVKDFSEVNNTANYLPGTVNLFLGEAYQYLTNKSIPIPEGFLISEESFNTILDFNHNRKKLEDILKSLNRHDFHNLVEIGRAARSLILYSDIPESLREEIINAKSNLTHPDKNGLRLLVRCGVSNIDRPGKYSNLKDVLLNISGKEELLKACLKCYAMLFSDEHIRYREENQISHYSDQMVIVVQQMIRSDLASSGIMYKSMEKGYENRICIEGTWGLVENITRRIVNPDIFFIYQGIEPEINQKAVINKQLGSKSKTLIYYDLPDPTKEAVFVNIDTQISKRDKFVLTDPELILLSNWMHSLVEWFNEPIIVNWAKDGLTNKIYLVQAYPGSLPNDVDVA